MKEFKYICRPTNQSVMKKSLILLALAAICAAPANAQILDRLANKALNAAERGVSKAVEKKTEQAAQKATEKILGGAEKAIDKQTDKAAAAVEQATINATQAYTDAVVESANAMNASAAELNAATDELRQANAAAGASAAAGANLMSSYMTLMGAGTPTYEDKGDEVAMTWKYINFDLAWTAKFKGDKCSSSIMSYTFASPELATQYYREQIDGMDKKEAKNWSVDGKTVSEDNTDEYADKDKIAVKAVIQQLVLSMGGKLE